MWWRLKCSLFRCLMTRKVPGMKQVPLKYRLNGDKIIDTSLEKESFKECQRNMKFQNQFSDLKIQYYLWNSLWICNHLKIKLKSNSNKTKSQRNRGIPMECLWKEHQPSRALSFKKCEDLWLRTSVAAWTGQTLSAYREERKKNKIKQND